MARTPVLAALVVVVLGAVPAFAHGTWIDARPLPGVTVGGTVDEVAFLFPEPLVPGSGTVVIIGPDGETHPTTGPLEHPADAVVRLPIEPISVEGIYTVSYTLPAVDGFVFTGSHRFEYRATAPILEPLPYGRSSVVPLVGMGGVVVVAGWMIMRRRRKNAISGEQPRSSSVGSD